jgi:hypothetical protein
VSSSAHRQNPRDQRPFNLMATHSGPARADDAIQGGARPMRVPRLATILALLTLLLGGLLTVTPPRVRADGGAAGEACFQETGFCVRGRFLDYWQQHGGLAINGFPLGDERQEILEDGNTYTVQYFERVRLEYHPENAPPYDVLLGQFGRRVLGERLGPGTPDDQGARAPAQPTGGQPYFAATGHNVPPDFFAYWAANGGLAQFGYPLTEVFAQGLEDGNTYQVQYFERARFERHPGNPTAWDIELGQFGRALLTEADQLSGAFGALYRANERVRGLLGAPTVSAFQVQGATQEFERGRMFLYGEHAGGGDLIAVLCGDPQAGRIFLSSRSVAYFLDPWGPSQPIGGGPGPQTGLYEPKRGFGLIWRDAVSYLDGPGGPPTRVRDCLGYATAPDEMAYALTAQIFARGVLLTTPDGQATYALYREIGPDGRPIARYERFALPTR